MKYRGYIIRRAILLVLVFVASLPVCARFVVRQGQDATLSLAAGEQSVVHAAARMLQSDYQHVLRGQLLFGDSVPQIYAATLGVRPLPQALDAYLPPLHGSHEAFLLCVVGDTLVVAGSDAHGTAYGLMHVSRLLGVSPWEWWADAMPRPLKRFSLPDGYRHSESPSVAYRGIFINDEDWGLRPWASNHYEPSAVKGQIGPRTTERIFQLMLRLRANLYWPPMHEGTEPFFLTPGNRQMAARYGIYIGGSHCEPMASSTAVEWGRRGVGEYDYVNNAPAVRAFWQQRLDEVKHQEIVYTLGMRGVHDGHMNGAHSVEEQCEVLTRVLHDQRRMLSQTVDSNLYRIPQVFIPYKEVLDVYNSGLQVPDDVTLMWCDDNYGYIRHFPTPEERARAGGNGLYYHVSYWGRPHDYLWLSTLHPALIRQQLLLAYDRGIRQMWVINVGDIKPAEYQLEMMMDMAWDIDAFRAGDAVHTHLCNFLSREFGTSLGRRLTPVMLEHYRLAHIRRPEFMAGTRVEESDRKRWGTIVDLPWSRTNIQSRLSAYASLSAEVDDMSRRLPADRLDAYFQLVRYPVQGAALHNRKLMMAQLARHGYAEWASVDAAFDSLQFLTAEYNTGIANGGKWQGIMDAQPRRLPVFGRVPHVASSSSMPQRSVVLHQFNAVQCVGDAVLPIPYLGYENGAAKMLVGKDVEFCFSAASDSVVVEVAVLPTHPVEGKAMLVQVELDGEPLATLDFATQGRSEQWKLNVLSNQAILSIPCFLSSTARHSLVLRALSSGIILDQVRVVRRGGSSF